MNLFIKKVVFFVLLITAVFLLIVAVNSWVVNEVPILVNEKKTILVLGDSNPECAVNDSVFSRSVNFSSSADSYFYSYLKLKKITEKNVHIDTLFLSFAPHNIFDNEWLRDDSHIYSNFRIYYPLMSFEDMVFLLKVNPKAVIKSIPSIIKQFPDNLIKILTKRSPVPGGYDALNRNILNEVQAKLKKGEKLPFFKIPETFEVSANEIKYLNKIIDYCKEKRIKLFLVNYPKRKELLEYPGYGVKEFNNYYDSNYSEIDFLDFSSLYLPDSYYADLVHLNAEGSRYFSAYLKNNDIAKLKEKHGHAVKKYPEKK